MRPITVASALSLLACLPSVMAARAGANVFGCVKMGKKPSEAFKVDFKVGSSADKCMDSIGNDASITIASAEITCASLGYVQEGCAFGASIWSLAYNGGAYSGSTKSGWSAPLFGRDNQIWLDNPVAGTFVCPSQHECPTQYLTWSKGTTGPLYIIFHPDTKPRDPNEGKEGARKEL